MELPKPAGARPSLLQIPPGGAFSLDSPALLSMVPSLVRPRPPRPRECQGLELRRR